MKKLLQFTGAMFAAITLMLGVATVQFPGEVFADCTGVAKQSLCQACEGAGGTFATGKCDNSDPASTKLTGQDSIFEKVVNLLTYIVGAISVIMLVIGGLRYVISGGDANAISSAKNTILYAIVGIVVAFSARAIVIFVLGEI